MVEDIYIMLIWLVQDFGRKTILTAFRNQLHPYKLMPVKTDWTKNDYQNN